MIPTSLLPAPTGTQVLVTTANAQKVPTGTLAVIADHLRDPAHTHHGWPIIAYPNPDPASITCTSTVIDPDALTITNPPPTSNLHPIDNIDPEVAAHVLWHYGAGGYRPGTFTRHLMQTISAADPTNRQRLTYSYPDYVTAIHLAAETPNGIHTLQHHMRTTHP